MEILFLVLLIGFCVIKIGEHIANHNGAIKFKNELEEKFIIFIGLVIIVIVCYFFNFNNIYIALFIMIMGFTFLIPLLIYFYRMSKAKEYKVEEQVNINYYNQEYILDKIDNMTGQEFEKFLIMTILPYDNFVNINGTAYTGDYGVDIVAEKNELKYAIQCKRFENKVTPKAIQEVVAGKKHYKCDKAIVISNNYFTKNAQQLAFDNCIELLDRDYIIIQLKKMLADPNYKFDYFNLSENEAYYKNLERQKFNDEKEQQEKNNNIKKTGGLGFFGIIAAILVGLISANEKNNRRR